MHAKSGVRLYIYTCMTVCLLVQYSNDLWRCYDPQFYGGKEAEAADIDLEGNSHYWRAQFPGQPFRGNEFDNTDNELPICTPAIANSASRLGPGALWRWLCVFAALVCTAFVLRSLP